MALFDRLSAKGFQVEFHSHAEAILSVDFPDAVTELEDVLLAASIPIEEIIAGGGGETKNTQRLRRGLAAAGWLTTTFTIEKVINGVGKEAISHKMDHVRRLPQRNGSDAVVALEIEWNNKDPFFDRDLENFKRLHAEGAISVGMIVTRGRSLHDNMLGLVLRFFDERQIQSFDDLLRWGYDPTARQRAAITKRIERSKNPVTFREAFANKFVADKFGEATTHWRKLDDRISRGVGNPCPIVTIGLPDSIVSFGEDPSTLQSIIDAVGDDE
ncbi:restriction endonuclease [Mesorhizobium sp. CA8]|uniref:BglII/BstYI family type II restriction endonuclease n=1 Tax=Mesorhizobium sp. CA8 TaxID=2876637 RepID=UPI001CCF2FF3|nr:BglII/BstYI family type II restriction endonuclease [Mesorhizobium sp. CA8]MBZ9763554.1 restriction endonuclease [Mesorhizobium sp. CA8]